MPYFTCPPARIQYRSFYLDAHKKAFISDQTPATPGTITYSGNADVDQTDGTSARFTHRFEKRTEFIGFSTAVLFMSTHAGDGIDVYVGIRKLDTDRNPLYHLDIPLRDMPGVIEQTVADDNVHKYIGPNDLQRASWRHALLQDPGLSPEARKLTTPCEVTLSFTKEEKIRPGQIVNWISSSSQRGSSMKLGRASSSKSRAVKFCDARALFLS